MVEETIFDKIRNLIGSVSFKIFLWSIKMSKDEYFKFLYKQESEEK